MLVGLDISKTATGWAVLDGSTCHSGVWRCPIEKPSDLGTGKIEAVYTGRVADWFRRQVYGLTQTYPITAAAIEQPMPGNSMKKRPAKFKGAGDFSLQANDFAPEVSVGTTAFDVTHFLHGLVVVAASVFARQKIHAVYVASQTWRSTMQVGRPPKQGRHPRQARDAQAEPKTRMVQTAGEAGLSITRIRVDSPDQAEAVLIALHLQTISEQAGNDMFRSSTKKGM